MTTPPRELGVGYAAATATLLSWVAVALLLEHFTGAIDVWTANGWRYGFAALLWLPLAAWITVRRGVRGIPWLSVAVPAALWFAGQIQFAASFYYVGPAMVTFMVRVQILGVIVFSAILIPSARGLLRMPGVWAGIAMMLGGAGGMVAFGETAPRIDDWTGVALAAGSGATFAAYGVALRFITPPADHPAKVRLKPMERFAFIAPMVGVGMVVLMLIFGERSGAVAAELSGRELGLLAISSFFGVMVGHLAYFTAIERIGVVAASSIVQVQPFLVLIASAFLFEETLTWPQVAAGTVLAVGAAVLVRVQTGRT
jgi:drug/metabolite transporter (DMT)-like permease